MRWFTHISILEYWCIIEKLLCLAPFRGYNWVDVPDLVAYWRHRASWNWVTIHVMLKGSLAELVQQFINFDTYIDIHGHPHAIQYNELQNFITYTTNEINLVIQFVSSKNRKSHSSLRWGCRDWPSADVCGFPQLPTADGPPIHLSWYRSPQIGALSHHS